MTAEEFNKKYELYLNEGHYGLSIDSEEFVNWLDQKFRHFITFPKFRYSQIKIKFGYGRFYCEGLPQELVKEVEEKITDFFN